MATGNFAIHEELAEPKALIVRIQGTADFASSEALSAALDRPIALRRSKLIVDFSETDFFSSTAWGCLMSAASKLVRSGYKVMLVGMGGGVLATYEALGLHDRLESVESIQDALRR